MMNRKALLGIVGIFSGCCVSVVFVELLVNADPGSGNLFTFSQFVMIALEGFIVTMRCGTRKAIVPLREYMGLVVLFFLGSTLNNHVFNFNISITFHLIFRSCSLVANMGLGMILLGKRYTFTKYMSIGMISLGITICTMASGNNFKESLNSAGTNQFSDYFWWLCGISILTLALFILARMGLYQETMHKTYGKHPREALFFTHFLPLPGFLLLSSDLLVHIEIANNSAPISVNGLTLPCIWFYILGNVLTQWICVNSVFLLTTECTSLTVTLVLTLRKFLSLLISIFYFNNPFTFAHWFGTCCIFGGTLLYSDVHTLILQSQTRKPLDKVQ